jgi:ABC-type Fe3+ transport system permease subunit
MHRPFRFTAHAVACATLVYCAAAPAEEMLDDDIDHAPSAEMMTIDLLVMRPLSLAGTVIGTAVFIVALPFNAITLNFADPARRLIVEPAEYTFTRKLGDLQ